MTTYLTIVTTALVITQIIRLIQNVMQLRRQSKIMKIQMDKINDMAEQDSGRILEQNIGKMSEANDLIIEYLKSIQEE